ncbi:YcaQ family DNA glycosylase [Streptomyces sp. ISL-10]|uniref:DNA glycosylase AlkZ-like family protein n=1 Tax=Streptomyces sp. ISL-10 TaxID=2819172 RepID=UPI001BE6E355|nr:crosslink repair DNA glycosylase YcaQ family protein [Streptomyces sp. ISL-10]MBT2366910.1 YcaQ family DNA glycosylase [Streptomyces sp. ISL-10]
MPPPALDLSADDARRIALRAQGLLGAPDRRGGVRGVLRHLGAVQLDTISVLARSHELIPYARLGGVGRRTVEEAYWTQGHSFEYWSHAACILPVEEWPHFAFRRRAYRSRPHWSHDLPDGAYDTVIKQLRAEGPLTATELGGAKNGGEWWDWSASKVAVERALMHGEVVCTERRSWKRVYDLAERAIPDAVLHDDLDDTECLRRLVRLAGQALGVGTRADIADYHRLKGEQFDAVVAVAMPLLAGGRLLGRVDPAREGRTLVARQVSLDGPRAVAPMAQALREAAEWVGCDSVRVERIDRPELTADLVRALG